MEYKKIKISNYNLHMIKTDKFKTISIDAIFRKNIKREEVTINNFLADTLTYSSKNYKTRRSMALKQQDLYGCEIDFSCYRIGKAYNTDFSCLFLNEKYTEEGMFEETIKYFKEIILDPNIDNNEFDNKTFEVVKYNTLKDIEGMKEDTRKYSMIRMLESMGEKELYSIHGYGYIDDLNKITPSNLYEYYNDFLKTTALDIYILGDIDFNKTEDIFREYFDIKKSCEMSREIEITHDTFKEKEEYYEEEFKTFQSKLSIGFKLKDLTDFEKSYVLTLFNMIYGGTSESRLFRNVREKNSLCYYIFSSSNKIDNLLFVTSGITKDNFELTLKLIKEELKDIQDGNITDEEVTLAKTRYNAIMDELSDYPSQIISYYYAHNLTKSDLPEQRKIEIQKVTKEDVINLSNKIFIDTVFLLGGDDNE